MIWMEPSCEGEIFVLGWGYSSYSMNILHFEKGLYYTDLELPMLAKKIGRLARYCERLKDAASLIRVETERRNTEKRNDQIKVTITVDLPRKQLRSESRRARPLDAIDRCVDKLEPQIKKYKELHTAKGRSRKQKLR
ncbi:hypothetical protein A3D88_03615 [Candidatus Peribacteria bacterium RIFCSPHIGHO2_02_FULL_52_16]|nr:MAG: hypothetical protein A2706_04430 [Candidatus Peribacteria bacterium RIFCSPHIGHO2_01_FULL_51_35]OGJ61771.1 MAG: hypothetical protein A3D88_03615 [Candidatus Peribacteria bacterium RIFCSPHIGHO2_02_FULL_52_16]